MTRHKSNLIAPWPQALGDGLQKGCMVAAREIRAPHGPSKQHIPHESDPLGWLEEHHVAVRVAGTVRDFQHQITYRDGIVLGQPTIGRENLGGWKPISLPLLWELVDPELILVMRPLDRHAEFAGQTGGGTGVIDMGMGDQ